MYSLQCIWVALGSQCSAHGDLIIKASNPPLMLRLCMGMCGHWNLSAAACGKCGRPSICANAFSYLRHFAPTESKTKTSSYYRVYLHNQIYLNSFGLTTTLKNSDHEVLTVVPQLGAELFICCTARTSIYQI